MKTRLFPSCRPGAVPAFLLCAFPLAMTMAFLADAPAVFAAPATPPAAPVPSKFIAFSDRATGRRLLFAARDSYRNAPSLRVTAKWTATGPNNKTTSGTETLLAQFGRGKLAVTSETDDAPKTVRRAVADGASQGGTLLVTQFQDAKPTPTRKFSRYPLDELTPLTRSLQIARFAPATKAGDLLLTPDWRLQTAALVYVSRGDSSSGSTAVIQTDLPAGRDRDQTKLTRRYLIDNKTGRLRRYEEWRTSQAPARPAPRLTYRREDYTEAASPLTAAAFSQTLPAGYTEQTAASATLPPAPRQPNADGKALALLRKWETAGERYLTLNAVADVRMSVQQRAENGRPNRGGRLGMDMLCTIWRMRPGQARIVVNGLDPRTQQPKTRADYVAVADGQSVRVNDYGNGYSNTDPQRDPAVVPLNRMRQVVRQAWDSGIGWIFDGPPAPEAFTQIAIDTTAQAPTLVFSRMDSGTGGRGQKTESRVLWRVTLGPDNLPRQIVSRRDTNIVGGYERDQPPSFTTTIRLQRIAMDAEPLPETFILPQEIARR